MAKQFAVFDIDGTIIKTSLMQLMARELVARGKLDIGTGQEIELLIHNYRQRNGEESYDKYMKRACELLFKNSPKGIKTEDFNTLLQSVVKSALLDTYSYTRELAQTLKRSGFFLLAISTSEVHATSALAQALGFDAWVGEFSFTEKNGSITGEVRSLNQTKKQLLDAMIQKFGLGMAGSTAIGDTVSNAEILGIVDSPIIFNPNQQLFKVARDKGWMIVIERKDMVYGMVQENGNYILKQVNV